MFPRKINHALAISGARTLGFEITDIVLICAKPTSVFLLFSSPTLHLTLSSLLSLFNDLTTTTCNPSLPFPISRRKLRMSINDFLQLAPETTLLRWLNHHLCNADHKCRIKNFSVCHLLLLSFVPSFLLSLP